MYEAILYEGALKLHMTYRTGGTDATYRQLLDLLDECGLVLDAAADNEARSLLLYLSCTQDMEFAQVTESPQLEAIERVWGFFNNELRIVHEIAGTTVYNVIHKPEVFLAFYTLILHTLPAKFIHEMWQIAWGNAQKTLYPATREVKPEAQLSDEDKADDFLDNGVQSADVDGESV